MRQAVANSWVIISNIICACVSCCCKNLISNSTRPIQFKNSCQKGEIAFPSSRNPKFPRGSMPPDSPWCFVASPLNVHSPKHSPLATPLPVPCIWLIFITDPSGNRRGSRPWRKWLEPRSDFFHLGILCINLFEDIRLNILRYTLYSYNNKNLGNFMSYLF